MRGFGARLRVAVAAAPRELLVRTKAKIIARAGIQLGATLDL